MISMIIDGNAQITPYLNRLTCMFPAEAEQGDALPSYFISKQVAFHGLFSVTLSRFLWGFVHW